VLVVLVVTGMIFIRTSGVLAERVGGRVIERLEVSGDDACMQVKVGFSFPIRYVKHFPDSFGEELRIYLSPIVVDPLDS